MKENFMYSILIIVLIGALVLLGMHAREDALQDIQFKKLKHQMDSVNLAPKTTLLSDYQEAFYIFLKKNPKAAGEFSTIMDSLNYK